MFQPFPKIPRLQREIVVTEKIDGTNASVNILTPDEANGLTTDDLAKAITLHDGYYMFAGSRTRFITPTDDNFGFAKWVQANSAALFKLGPGRHYGEWWGSGIQRGYGKTNGDKVFSLFNTYRWAEWRPECCSVVPVLLRSNRFESTAVAQCLDMLRLEGSQAAPGFKNPEGIVVFHSASGALFKQTIDKDEEPKGKNR